MIKQKQVFLHNPDAGQIGDCHRTAIACLLDMKPEDVPHFVGEHWGEEDYDWKGAVNAFLAAHGYASVDVYYSGESDLDIVLHAVGTRNPGAYYLLGGQSPRGFDHTVIGCGERIEWDPHPDGTGLVAPLSNGCWEVTFIVPLSMTRAAA